MKKFFGPVALAAMAAVVSPALKADAPPQCSMGNAIMQGTYVTSGSGSITGVGPLLSVGIVTYNGDGTGTSNVSTTTINGASSTSTNTPATFTVNQDCTGTKTIGASHFNFVITPDGSTITWIVTDHSVNMTGTAVRLKR